MKPHLICLLLAGLLIMPGFAGAVSLEDFKVQTTENLVNLCNAPAQDPLHAQAVNFCHGFLVGAYHYYAASVGGPESKPFVCPPDPRPTRNEAIGMFIEWIKTHPDYWNEPAVESEFRFLAEKWPCQ